MRQWRRRHREPSTVYEEEPEEGGGAEAYGAAHGGPRVNGSAEGRRDESRRAAATKVGEKLDPTAAGHPSSS